MQIEKGAREVAISDITSTTQSFPEGDPRRTGKIPTDKMDPSNINLVPIYTEGVSVVLPPRPPRAKPSAGAYHKFMLALGERKKRGE